MIPKKLKTLLDQQEWLVKRPIDKQEDVKNALIDLGIPLDTEFAEFYLLYSASGLSSNISSEELIDIICFDTWIKHTTVFIRETWGLPENYVCLTTAEGEGCYLYDKNSGRVLDFDLAKRDEFLEGGAKLEWASFYEFMIWYLSPAQDQSG